MFNFITNLETINKIKATKLLWTEDRKKEVRLNQSNKNNDKRNFKCRFDKSNHQDGWGT